MAHKSIDPLTLKGLCVDLRRELLLVLDRVEPADPVHYRDNTLSNAGIGRLIQGVLHRFRDRNKEIGLIILRRHISCPIPEHDHEYIMDPVEDLRVEFEDDRFVWRFGVGTNMNENCRCPCTADAPTTAHSIMYDALINKEFEVGAADMLFPVYSDILYAFRDTLAKTPRTAVQVSLLEAVLKLNDLILPVPVQAFIDSWHPLKSNSS